MLGDTPRRLQKAAIPSGTLLSEEHMRRLAQRNVNRTLKHFIFSTGEELVSTWKQAAQEGRGQPPSNTERPGTYNGSGI